MSPGALEEDAEALMESAFESLDVGDAPGAMKLGRQLEKIGWSGGYEVQARAHMLLDAPDKALAILRKGLRKGPDVGPLWQVFGNVLSELGFTDEAMRAFDQAGVLNEDPASLAYNRTLALMRVERWGEAEAALAPVLERDDWRRADSDLACLIVDARARILRNSERNQECIDFLESSRLLDDHDAAAEVRAPLHAQLAHLELEAGRRSAARARAHGALSLDKSEPEALWVLRELGKARDYSHARYFRILVQGEIADDTRGFFATYDVVADDEAEALALIAEIEPPEFAQGLAIEESEVLDSPPGPKGVYRASPGYTFFSREGADPA